MSDLETHDAIVTNPKDPDQEGKIKVKCASLFDGDQELPFWIKPRFHYAGKEGGWFAVPPKDSWVELEVPAEASRSDEVPFEQSLQSGELIRYKCTTYNTVQQIPKLFKTNFPQRLGYAFASGMVFFHDSKTPELTMGYVPDDKPEVWLKFLKDQIQIETKAGFKIHITGDKMLLESPNKPIELAGSNGVLIGGSAATEPLVLGNELNTYLTTVTEPAASFGAMHTHAVTAVGSPTGPPNPVMPAPPSTLLSQKHKTE